MTGTATFRYSWQKIDGLGSVMVYFSYYVDGQKYERGQVLPPDYKKLYPDLKKGKSYKVTYLDDNVKRAIIDLNVPK